MTALSSRSAEAESRASIPVRGVAIAACAELAIQPAGDFLEEAGGDAALGLAQLFFLAGQPRHLDHATFALVGQVSVERVVGALEDHELAVQRFHFRRDRGVDVVDLRKKTQATVAGIVPT